ncbi:hypothetical protein Agub_g1949, partial [Astrephomene gubernaculifera]
MLHSSVSGLQSRQCLSSAKSLRCKPFLCCPRRLPRRLKVQAIGFDFGDDDSRSSKAPTKLGARVGSLGSLASSLLVYGSVLKGSVGEAFLQALQVTQKYQASSKEVLTAYGRLFSLLLAAGYDSWADYLLDQILLGRDNSFARAAAQGSLEAGGGAPLLRAVSYDLDVLQELALSMNQIAELVADAAPAAGPYWQEAATSLSLKSPSSSPSNSPGTSPPPVVTPLDPHSRSPFITRPPHPEELAGWRAALSGRDSWGEAVPLLEAYYHRHGFGITSRNSTLRWIKGAFEEGPDAPSSSSSPSVLSPPHRL